MCRVKNRLYKFVLIAICTHKKAIDIINTSSSVAYY